MSICPVCNVQTTTAVHIEVINITANDVVSLQTCKSCATSIALRTGKTLLEDVDHLLYTTLGTIGGALTN